MKILSDEVLLTRDRIHEINLETGKRMRELADTTDGKFSPGEMGDISWAGEYAKLEAQHKDTLRQVRELLDGIKNPWDSAADEDYIYGFNEAIQTIRALLEE